MFDQKTVFKQRLLQFSSCCSWRSYQHKWYKSAQIFEKKNTRFYEICRCSHPFHQPTMKSPGTPLCGGMAGGGPADLARAPSVPPNISKKSGSQSHKNWRFNFQVNHFVGFCCFLSHFIGNILSFNVASRPLHWNMYNICGTWFRIWCPNCWRDFIRSMKRPCVN